MREGRSGLAAALLLVSGWAAMPAQAQRAMTAADASCGNDATQFRVTQAGGDPPAQAPAGKALVFFIEKDVGALLTATSRVGVDGHWMGATHGDSWFAFPIDPGVHHLCASSHFSGWVGGGEGIALAHFEAQPGGMYYFEVKNIAYTSERQTDMSLTQLDSDEGRFLLSTERAATSVRRN